MLEVSFCTATSTGRNYAVLHTLNKARFTGPIGRIQILIRTPGSPPLYASRLEKSLNELGLRTSHLRDYMAAVYQPSIAKLVASRLTKRARSPRSMTQRSPAGRS